MLMSFHYSGHQSTGDRLIGTSQAQKDKRSSFVRFTFTAVQPDLI